MTTSTKKTTSRKSPATKATPAKDETMTIVQIARVLNRSPKVLRAIARNEPYRVSQGKQPRLPAPVEKHVYRARDLDAFREAIDLMK